MNYSIIRENELYHHGIKGMHWGIRRYQNYDGIPKASFRTRRLQKAVSANERDVKSLRDNGYKELASAVKTVGDKNRVKLAKSKQRDTYKQKITDASIWYNDASKTDYNTFVKENSYAIDEARKYVRKIH